MLCALDILVPRTAENPRMQLELQCKKCEDSFVAEVTDLQTEAKLRCAGCGAHVPEEQVETLVGALEELFAALAPMRRKFTINVELDSEDMPPPYDEAPVVTKKETALLDEEENEDADEEDEDDEEARDVEF